MLEEAVEGTERLAVRVAPRSSPRLTPSARAAAPGRPARRCFVGEGDAHPRTTQLPNEMGGEQADDGAHPVRQAVTDRTDVEIDALHGGEVPLQVREARA